MLAKETEQRGAQAIVNLIATDERIFNFRHPLPADKQMEKYAMLVLCGRKRARSARSRGWCTLVRSRMNCASRWKPWPSLTPYGGQDTARPHAWAMSSPTCSRPTTVTGFADEWQLHHQGGPAGYEPREVVATPGAPQVVEAGQTYAWNPSITGRKVGRHDPHR